jgi:hypothetical protein
MRWSSVGFVWPKCAAGWWCVRALARCGSKRERYRACGMTHSMAAVPVNNRKKSGRRTQPPAFGFPVSCRMKKKKRALAAAIGSAGLTLDNRSKQDENRKRAQPGLAGRPFVRRLERLRRNTLLGRLPSLPGFIRGSIISVLVFASYDFKQPISFPRRILSRHRTPLPAPPSGSPPQRPLNERGCESI